MAQPYVLISRHCLGNIAQMSRFSSYMDVVTAHEQIGLIINEIRTIRTRADEEFDCVFSQSVKMATLAVIGEIAMPRIARRQTLHTKVLTEDRSAQIY